MTPNKGGGFCQWVADNFDYNEDTLTEHDTTHVMGIITCQTPGSVDKRVETISRKNITAEEIANAGHFGDFVIPYKSKSKTIMVYVMIKPVCPVNITVTNYEHMDTLWLYSSRQFSNPPNWQGFVSEVVKGDCQCSAVMYNPMVQLNPQTNEAVYSTLLFVGAQAKKAGMCCATLTFDQPLYAKGYKIK